MPPANAMKAVAPLGALISIAVFGSIGVIARKFSETISDRNKQYPVMSEQNCPYGFPENM